MPNTGNKIFDNRRKWNVDISNPYIPSTPSDTYLSGTHSFSFQIYIERNCDIEIYLDTTTQSSTQSSYTINYLFNGTVQNFPVVIQNINPNNYNFRFKVVDLSNTYEYGALIDVNTSTEPNDLNGMGPYFSPVYDGLTCPIGSTTSITTTTTTTTSTTTTTTTLPSCTISGSVTGYVVTQTTTTTTTTAPPPPPSPGTTTTSTTTTTTTGCLPFGTLLSEECIGLDRWGTYADGSCGTYMDIIESNSPLCGGGIVSSCKSNMFSPCMDVVLPEGATSCEDIGMISC